jgi:hypothetical protein
VFVGTVVKQLAFISALLVPLARSVAELQRLCQLFFLAIPHCYERHSGVTA